MAGGRGGAAVDAGRRGPAGLGLAAGLGDASCWRGRRTAPPDASFFGYFFAGLTAMVGFWATLSLNIPDFSRFAKSQRAQIIGQIVGLPLTMVLFAGLGVVMTAASAQTRRRNGLRSHHADRQDRQSVLGRGVDDHHHHRDHLDQHRGEHRLADQRFPEPGAAAHQPEDAACCSPASSASRSMSWELLKRMGWLAVGRQRRQPVFELAARLFEPARPDRRHHGGGLFRGAEAALRPAGAVPATVAAIRPGISAGFVALARARWH